MHGWYSGWAWWEWTAMTMGIVAFWAFVGWKMVASIRLHGTLPDAEFGSAQALLTERRATGDIGEAEYRTRLAAIRSAEACVD